eukprot:1137333-Pelagomonas_calceolata.AAC.14
MAGKAAWSPMTRVCAHRKSPATHQEQGRPLGTPSRLPTFSVPLPGSPAASPSLHGMRALPDKASGVRAGINGVYSMRHAAMGFSGEAKGPSLQG